MTLHKAGPRHECPAPVCMGESIAEQIHNAVTVQEAHEYTWSGAVPIGVLNRHEEALKAIARQLDEMGCVKFETRSCFAQLSHDSKTVAVGRLI